MRVFTFGMPAKISSIDATTFEAGFFPGAEMRAGMQDDERQAQLIRARQFFRERPDRVRVKLRVGRRRD